MGQNTNIGQDSAVTVFGNPESFKKLIKNHGQLCKIKQALVCPCIATNSGSADYNCTLCNGDGYVYSYQRHFLVTDENSRSCGKVITPFWNPILSVSKAQNVTSCVQGGITNLTVESFDSTTITVKEAIKDYEKKRVTYSFDGWTYVQSEKLRVDTVNKLMYADGTIFDAGYQSSNPLNAYSDIAQIVRIWNSVTGIVMNPENYSFEGNVISTTEAIDNNMYIEYYSSDMTQVINTDVVNRDLNEVWTHDPKSGECRMAFYPYWELSKGDIVTLSSTILYKNEQLQHRKDLDRLFEIEIFSLNNEIFDESGNIYKIDIDYILQGRHIKWIGSKPDIGKAISVRYGYKPSYIIFEDNPMPNNLENKQYPIIVMGKSWSKISKDDVARLRD
jgi:hypothetical protein